MPNPISHISSISAAQSLHSATDSPVSAASPEPSALGNQEPHFTSNQPPQTPDSALPTASVIDAEDPPAEQLTSSTTDSEAQANKKKTHKKSNRYTNQSKAKVHIGACAVGGITLGILAGPIGLVFAAAYINAMCGSIYGGSEYFTGDKAKHPKTEPEPEPQPENTSPSHRPSPNSVPSEEGRRPDESDTEQGRKHVGQPNATINSNNFIFAPTIITSPTTTEGNVYFFREDDKNHKSTTEQKTSSTASQTNNSSHGSSTPEVKVDSVSTLNRQQATADKPAPVAADVDAFFDSVDGDTVLHVRFNDGVNAFVHAPESMTSDILTRHSHLLNRPSQTVVTTGKESDQTDAKEVQHPKPSQHHRSDGFEQMFDAPIAHSENSARLVANEEKPSIGKNGTHSWQLQQQGSWQLKSITKTAQHQRGDGADGLQTSSGSAFERLNTELKKLNPNPFNTLPITPESKTEKSVVSVKRDQQYSKPLSTKELMVETSSQWTKEIMENGQSRWVKPQQSLGNETVLLTGGAVSGLGQNFSQGIRNNVKPLDELKVAHLQRLKKTIKNNNEATRLSTLRSGGLVVVGPAVDEQNLILA